MKHPKKRRIVLKLILLSTLVIFAAIAAVIAFEAKTSYFQSRYFAKIAKKAAFKAEAGENKSIIWPQFGPFNERAGYIDLPKKIERIKKFGYKVKSQARWSPDFAKIVKDGYYPPYNEKVQNGLDIEDKNGKKIFTAKNPKYAFSKFEEIPDIIIKTLLFIEDRKLLSDEKYKNPVMDFDRVVLAQYNYIVKKMGIKIKVHGASTLATQLMKFRNSNEGLTGTVKEKFKQMMSASLRAYLAGRDTTQTRKQIVVDFINSVPLGAAPGYGEVLGICDGLAAWFGINPEDAQKTLRSCGANPLACGMIYRQILALFIAERRPSYYLKNAKKQLENLTDSHLRILVQEGIIGPVLFAAASNSRLKFNERFIWPRPDWLKNKLPNAVKIDLLSLLNVISTYTLERMDLKVRSYLDKEINEKVLDKLKKVATEADKTLVGRHLLKKTGKNDLILNFLLLENLGNINAIRVQTGTYPSQFDPNDGGKLEYGSTAKARTAATFIQLHVDVFHDLSKLNPEELKTLKPHPQDTLTQWVAEWMLAHPNGQKKQLIEDVMEREFSSSPAESFFTGGRWHHFSNFKKSDNVGMASIRYGLQNSVNLIYARAMQEIILHLTYYENGQAIDDAMENPESELRKAYLDRFVDEESKLFLFRFYQKYKPLGAKSFDALIEEIIARKAKPLIKAKYLSAIFRTVCPDASFEEFARFILTRVYIPEKKLDMFYNAFDPFIMNIQDLGASARKHPLELWTVKYFTHTAKPTFDNLYATSKKARRKSYGWLYKPSKFQGQSRRIATIIEIDAFKKLEAMWQKLGYPFKLIPSYATAIGSSGDRPDALAQFMGIIANKGRLCPSGIVEKLHFAPSTPYETVVEQENQCAQVMDPDIAAAMKQMLSEVVEFGTAIRLKNLFITNSCRFPIGGKTGTGDNRIKSKNSERILNRTATFVFFAGDRFFGIITIYVPGEKAAEYSFTSSLPVQVLKNIWPELKPMVGGCN